MLSGSALRRRAEELAERLEALLPSALPAGTEVSASGPSRPCTCCVNVLRSPRRLSSGTSSA